MGWRRNQASSWSNSSHLTLSLKYILETRKIFYKLFCLYLGFSAWFSKETRLCDRTACEFTPLPHQDHFKLACWFSTTFENAEEVSKVTRLPEVVKNSVWIDEGEPNLYTAERKVGISWDQKQQCAAQSEGGWWPSGHCCEPGPAGPVLPGGRGMGVPQ